MNLDPSPVENPPTKPRAAVTLIFFINGVVVSSWVSRIPELQRKLGISEGETTPDGMFTLKTVECLASCGTAPMMQVGDNYIEDLTCEKLDGILEDLKNAHQNK